MTKNKLIKLFVAGLVASTVLAVPAQAKEYSGVNITQNSYTTVCAMRHDADNKYAKCSWTKSMIYDTYGIKVYCNVVQVYDRKLRKYCGIGSTVRLGEGYSAIRFKSTPEVDHVIELRLKSNPTVTAYSGDRVWGNYFG